MTDLTHDAIRKLLDGATSGPWLFETVRTSCGVCHKIGPWPHKWRHGADMSACIYDDYPSPPEGTDTMLANARLIAAAPDLARLALEQAAEIARLREALVWYTEDTSSQGDIARAALKGATE